MKKISILGCGWLGLPLAKFLLSKDYIVKGSTTDRSRIKALENNSIKPFFILINPDVKGENLDNFFDTNILIINFPPKRRDDIVSYHEKQISNLITKIIKYKVKNVIFVSSTSVYPNINSTVKESDNLNPDKNSGRALITAEKLLFENNKFNTTILRFAGLIGYDRNPINSIKRKNLVLNSSVPVNLIHRDDCINIIFEVIKNDVWNEVFNGCCDKHPTRKEYYSVQAQKNNIALPKFDDSKELEYKIVSNEKVKKALNYRFKYPDPLKI